MRSDTQENDIYQMPHKKNKTKQQSFYQRIKGNRYIYKEGNFIVRNMSSISSGVFSKGKNLLPLGANVFL